MATVYPTSAGAWSTRTWNNDATGSAYGMAPQAGDTVLANGLAITIDAAITVAAISTRVGTTASAGGSFSVNSSGVAQIVVTANCYAGTTTCLVASNGSKVVGNSFGSNTTASVSAVTLATLN